MLSNSTLPVRSVTVINTVETSSKLVFALFNWSSTTDGLKLNSAVPIFSLSTFVQEETRKNKATDRIDAGIYYQIVARI